MHLVQKRHSLGRPGTVAQKLQPPGDYWFIEEAGRLYHYCFVHKAVAERTMTTLQASWDELTTKLKAARSQLRELLSAEDLNEKLIATVTKRINTLEEASLGRSEQDRDLFTNFEEMPSHCVISARQAPVFV